MMAYVFSTRTFLSEKNIINPLKKENYSYKVCGIFSFKRIAAQKSYYGL